MILVTTISSTADRDSNDTSGCAESDLLDSDSDSLNSEDINLDIMSTSQFLFLPEGTHSPVLDLGSLTTILSDDEEDDVYLTPSSSIQLSSVLSSSHSPEGSIPTITVITPETEISYARETFSPSLISHLLPAQFKDQQFVKVLEGDAVVVLEELTEFLWIVRVCRTQMIGIIPAWNIEGELERIARINMTFNGRVSSPLAEFTSPLSSPSSLSSESESSVTNNSTPTSPSSVTDDRSSALEATIESLYVADESFYGANKVREGHGPKSVGFVSTRPQSVYRYPSETYIHGEYDEAEPDDHQFSISTYWSYGWVEGDEEDHISEDFVRKPPDFIADTKSKTRRGRKRNRKRVPTI